MVIYHKGNGAIFCDMDLSDPTRAVTATLDGPVLAVLAKSGQPLTVGQVTAKAARGSEIGIRRSLARLTQQGIVRTTVVGRNQVHELNRDHIAAVVAIALSDLRLGLWQRFREELATWQVPALHAAVFGSAARGDGHEASDIDLLLVHPLFPSEKKLSRLNRSVSSKRSNALDDFAASDTHAESEAQWHRQVDSLRRRAERWTGNALQVVDLSFHEWQRPDGALRRLLDEVDLDGIEISGSPRSTPTGGQSDA
jgi:predicted nucleotidyltransferase